MRIDRKGGAASGGNLKPAGKPGAAKSPAPKPPARGGLTLALPEEAHEPIQSLGDCVTLIHGEKKIGKTSLCGQFPDALFLGFEPGTKGLRVKAVEIKTWREFLGYLDLLEKRPDYAKTLIVDTVDIAYTRCSDYVCGLLGIQHPGDEGFGKGWAAVELEFTKTMGRLQLSGRGVIFVSHTDAKEFQRPNGSTYHKLVPTMSNQARKYLTGTADIIAYYGYYGQDRYVTLAGSDALDAGHRLQEKFRTPSGEPIHSVPMGKSAAEGYHNLVNAFNNKQKDRHEPDLPTGLTDVRTKPGQGKRGRR